MGSNIQMKKTNLKNYQPNINFLFDQWGVLHDGNKIFKHTNKTLRF